MSSVGGPSQWNLNFHSFIHWPPRRGRRFHRGRLGRWSRIFFNSHLSFNESMILYLDSGSENGPRAGANSEAPSAPYFRPPPYSLQVTNDLKPEASVCSASQSTRMTQIYKYKECLALETLLSKVSPAPRTFRLKLRLGWVWGFFMTILRRRPSRDEEARSGRRRASELFQKQ